MFPIRDSHPTSRVPFINYLIILANILVFFVQFSGPDFEGFIFQYGFIPASFNFFDLSTYKNIFSSIFMHGGVFHILSNMWFLHIFGDNIEDRFGHMHYLVFYLIGGFVAAMTQYFIASQSQVPMIGASGAVSAIAGAYFVLFKESRVKTLVTFFFIWDIIELPATFVLGYWFITQLFAGVGSLATVDVNQGGIAFFAHIGGFAYGWFLAKTLKK
jgi:hypothetical protein